MELHEEHHLEKHAKHEFNEAVVGNGVGKLLLELSTYAAEVVLLEVSLSAEMIAYRYGHNLTLGKPSLVVPVSLPAAVTAGKIRIFTQLGIQILVNLVNNTENFRSIVVENHRAIVL